MPGVVAHSPTTLAKKEAEMKRRLEEEAMLGITPMQTSSGYSRGNLSESSAKETSDVETAKTPLRMVAKKKRKQTFSPEILEAEGGDVIMSNVIM